VHVNINKWWVNNPDERFWIETTDRVDVGIDLNAPQLDESGQVNWRYSLIEDVGDGDVVFHYRKQERAITAWSWAVGSTVADQVRWAAHGTSARGRGVIAYERPGWRLGLEGPFPLARPLTLDQIAARAGDVRRLVADLRHQHGTLYFPFELSARRPPRPLQGYIFKLPASFRELFPALSDAMPRVGAVASPQPANHVGTNVGQDYVEADVGAAISGVAPFAVDPSVVDRGRRGHARTQNLVAEQARLAGLRPIKASPDDPQFDVAWESAGHLYVREVKSLTKANEEQQLRLGLGQVLRYRHLLEQRGRTVTAVLAGERRPTDPSWDEVCQRYDVVLVWPDVLSSRLFANVSHTVHS
jgi:hypothetical protein